MSKQHRFMRTLSIALVAVLAISSAPFSAMSGISLPSFGSLLANAADEEPVWTVATEDMLEIEGNTIIGFKDKLPDNIEIPTHINGTAITTIAASAFKGCSTITAVKISEQIAAIGTYAFQNCSNLEKVYFNSNSCEIATDWTTNKATAFAFNNNLTEFVFGENVTAIPANVCYNATNLQTVTFKGKVTNIGAYSFANCSSLKAIDLSAVTTIGSNAFASCVSIEKFDFSDNLETIGSYTFYDCRMAEINVPAKVKSIGTYAFQNCSNLEKVYFNSNSCEIATDWTTNKATAFAFNNNLTEFVFGENVIVIPANICYNATKLEIVTFEGKVTAINKNAFANCTSLSDVSYNAGSQADWKKPDFTFIVWLSEISSPFALISTLSSPSTSLTVISALPLSL